MSPEIQIWSPKQTKVGNISYIEPSMDKKMKRIKTQGIYIHKIENMKVQ